MQKLLGLANASFGVAVDADIRGSAITQLDSLMFGAYGPAVARAMNAVAIRGKQPISREEFEQLARAAFALAVDKYFNDTVIHDYGILFDQFGYGPDIYRLACLVADDPSRVTRPMVEPAT